MEPKANHENRILTFESWYKIMNLVKLLLSFILSRFVKEWFAFPSLTLRVQLSTPTEDNNPYFFLLFPSGIPQCFYPSQMPCHRISLSRKCPCEPRFKEKKKTQKPQWDKYLENNSSNYNKKHSLCSLLWSIKHPVSNALSLDLSKPPPNIFKSPRKGGSFAAS